MKLDLSNKFWLRVNIRNKKTCWEWQGSLNNSGYGTVSRDGKVYTAHRIAAWLAGLVTSPSAPKDKTLTGFVLHKCDNRKCCNPWHFFIGTYSDNQKDAYNKKRRTQPKGELHTNSKLTDAQADTIRKMYATGIYFQQDLAERFSVSQRVVSLIVRNETYI